jgi:hypothetical protein
LKKNPAFPPTSKLVVKNYIACLLHCGIRIIFIVLSIIETYIPIRWNYEKMCFL